MHPASYIASFFRSPKPPAGERGECDFDLVGRYFYNNSQEERAFETIEAETASDLDLNAVFERIPHTTRNAIRILELYDYPPELIDEALEAQQRLLAKKERA